MTDLSVRVKVTVERVEDHFDDEETDLLTRQLKEELLELDVQSVVIPAAMQPPPGAKGVDAGVLGTLLITASDPGLLAAIVETIKTWVGRSNQRSARLEIDGEVLEVGGLSAHDQDRLIDLYISRHNQASS